MEDGWGPLTSETLDRSQDLSVVACSAGLQAAKSRTKALLAQQPQITPQYGLISAKYPKP